MPTTPKTWVLRLFACSWGVMSAGAATLLHDWRPASPLWLAALGLAGCFSLGVVVPGLMRAPYRWVDAVLGPLGHLLSLVVLAVIFYGVFTPYALVLRRFRRDPLRLDRRSRPDSAWIDRDDAARTGYFWQY